MLEIRIHEPGETEAVVHEFHRDGFVAVSGLLDDALFRSLRERCFEVIRAQTDADPERKGNRGHHRYSFGYQLHHPEWRALIDLPALLPLVERIFGDGRFRCAAAGGDYSLPGAEIQPLHSDMAEFVHDPLYGARSVDLPTPFLVVNFLMVDYTPENGPTRFVPGTHRSRAPVPSLEEEPVWMRECMIEAPAGTAILRDVRCWHGGTANRSEQIRPMTSVGYFAPWFIRPGAEQPIRREDYGAMSRRARELSRLSVRWDEPGDSGPIY